LITASIRSAVWVLRLLFDIPVIIRMQSVIRQKTPPHKISDYIWELANMSKRLLFTFILIAGFFPFLSAQNKGKEIPFRMSIRACATVPHSISNKAFRRSFTGIYDVTVSFNYQVFHGINVGIQYRNNEWKTADNKIPGLNTYAQSHHGGLRVEYDMPVSDNSTAYIGLMAEEGMIKYFGLSFNPGTDLSDLQKKYYYHTIEAETGIFFYTEGSFAIGVHTSAVFTNYAFNPYSIHLDQHKAYVASDLNGKWAHIDVGFVVVYSFFKKGGKTD
jgi:hypothetical protein